MYKYAGALGIIVDLHTSISTRDLSHLPSQGTFVSLVRELLELRPIWEKQRTYTCCDRYRCIRKVGLSKISATRKKISRYSDKERKEFLL